MLEEESTLDDDDDDDIDDDAMLGNINLLDAPSTTLKCVEEMKKINDLFLEKLARHFALRVDLRKYEDLKVKLESGEVLLDF